MTQASHHLGRRRGRVLFCNTPQLKVRLKDNRLCPRAFRHLALTSCQQLRKGSLSEGISKVNNQQVGRWDEQRRHLNPQPTCPMIRSTNWSRSTKFCVSTADIVWCSLI